jgi:hypothetical protein
MYNICRKAFKGRLVKEFFSIDSAIYKMLRILIALQSLKQGDLFITFINPLALPEWDVVERQQ